MRNQLPRREYGRSLQKSTEGRDGTGEDVTEEEEQALPTTNELGIRDAGEDGVEDEGIEMAAEACFRIICRDHLGSHSLLGHRLGGGFELGHSGIKDTRQPSSLLKLLS